MTEQYKVDEIIEEENGLVEEENIKKEYRFSWRRMLGWVAILLSLTSPLIAIGISLICINTADEDEKNEVSIICYVALGVAAFFFILDLISRVL